MILTCANCDARYLVPDNSLGRDGRRVRCTNCDHEWFQEPDDYDEDIQDEDLEPIPEAVKPLRDEESLVPAIPADERPDEEKERVHVDWVGYAAAAAVFLLVTGALVVLKAPITKSWPPSAAFYALLGFDTPVEGEGLIFEQLAAVSKVNEEGIQVLAVEGRIINLDKEKKTVPALQAALRTDLGEDIDNWLVDTGADEIGSEGELRFETSYPEIDKTVKEVNLQFVLGGKGIAHEKAAEVEDEHEDSHGPDHH